MEPNNHSQQNLQSQSNPTEEQEDSQMQNEGTDNNSSTNEVMEATSNQINSSEAANVDMKSESNMGSSLVEQDMQMAADSTTTGIQMRGEENLSAPIEIKQKNEENAQTFKVSEPISKEQADLAAIEKRKKEVQQCAVKLFKQVKAGCQKDICFNTYCRKNPYCYEEFVSNQNDKQILLHCMKVLMKTKYPEELICSESKSINRQNIDEKSDQQLVAAFEDIYEFCSSFVDKEMANQSPIKQCSIDFMTMTKFYKRVVAHCGKAEKEKDQLQHVLLDFYEIMDHVLQQDAEQISTELAKTSLRGLIMLLHLQEMEEFQYFSIFEKTIGLIKHFSEILKNKTDKKDSEFIVSFLRDCVPKHEFQQTIMKFQNYITLVIIQNIFTQEQIMHTIEVMDYFFLANKQKPRREKIKESEFYNDALNRDVDLKKQAQIYYQEWQSALRHGKTFDRHSFFTLYNYPWTLNAYRKAELFKTIANNDRYDFIGQALLSNLTNLNAQDPNASLNSIFNSAHFSIKIRRDNILEDSLNNLVNREIKASHIRKPLRVVFENEPAIDEGGVKKEYFQLVFKELFNPDWGMFKYNPDNRLYWFNGKTFEDPLKFELIGTLLGLAASNQVILDIPILSTCYKLLLGDKPNMDDLEMWQPDVAQSFKFILDYDKEQPLEDVLARTFTIDSEQFGEKITDELKPGGADIFVTKENRQEFIDLYIEFLFEKQCITQVKAFRAGFFRLFDREMLANLYSSEELEQFVCGCKNLDFRQLQKVTKYIKPLHPEHEIVKWFWDIVFNEFDDDQRKKLLAFTTGSDRAPITGLEDVEFILGLEGEDENKLPVAHTCFNQLLFPVYKTREAFLAKLTQAVENSEGFGMV